MVDIGYGAGEFQSEAAEQLSVRYRFLDQRHRRITGARRGEVGAVGGQPGVDLVGHRFA